MPNKNSSSIFFQACNLNPFIKCDVLNVVNSNIYVLNKGMSNLFKDGIPPPLPPQKNNSNSLIYAGKGIFYAY